MRRGKEKEDGADVDISVGRRVCVTVDAGFDIQHKQ